MPTIADKQIACVLALELVCMYSESLVRDNEDLHMSCNVDEHCFRQVGTMA